MSSTAVHDYLNMSLSQMEAAAARFEERLNQALVAAPPSKALVRDAIRRRGVPRCPVRNKRLSLDVILRYGDALADLFCEYPDDLLQMVPYEAWVGHQAAGRPDPINVIDAMTGDRQWTDEWGTRWGHAFGGVGATQLACPITDWSQLDQYLETQMPDARAPGRLDAAKKGLALHGRRHYCAGAIQLSLFERLHSLRGMENLFMDFYTHPDEVRRLAEAITDYLLELIRAWGELGADGIFMTDDWGTQTALMIAVPMWRDFFEDLYRKIIAEAHRGGMEVFFHSCGNVTGIVSHLIDVGLDVIDPIQPGAMDLDQVAREFGGKVAFSGGIDDQRIALAKPREVADEVRRAIDTLGAPFGNAYVVAPANVLTPEVPLENLQALFKASHGQ